jgi:steroid delta-isomerase-like uncharacterized protein
MGEARSIVEGFYEAFGSADFEAAHRYVSDDIENTDPTGTIRGWDAFRQFIETFKQAIPDAKLVADRIVEEGNVTATQGRFQGTFTAPLRTPQGELPPNGQAFDLPFAEVNVIEDGRIWQHTVYYDQLTFLSALGAMQPPA